MILLNDETLHEIEFFLKKKINKYTRYIENLYTTSMRRYIM